MDTKFFHAALQEFIDAARTELGPQADLLSVADVSLTEFGSILCRAQELKDADAAARDEERS